MRYQGLKSTVKSEAKIRASRRTRPIVRCVSVAKSSRRAAAVRQQRSRAPEKPFSTESLQPRRDPARPEAQARRHGLPLRLRRARPGVVRRTSTGTSSRARGGRDDASANQESTSEAGHGPEEAEATEDGLPLLLRRGAQGGFGCGSRQGQSRQQHVEQAVRHDLGVPSCGGAFTPSTRLVSRNDGSGWFLL